MAIGMPELVIILFVVALISLVIVWPAGRICRRVGFSPWLGVFAGIPLANLALLWFIALAPWPASGSSKGGA
ncbi:MAG TPA: hypothetical protein VF579_05795 [Candidatus Methylomirabilis sp.]